ncbi:hypothetical protein O181_091709 [Austropuccinia psidii MF-1]|uniref:Vta1 C-terminal domain-containing protein n=1 Tax=Austropuccinia psidii MF-1 TaxID=1389203 RepID=A0A9Q3IY36_9BASI|nr:hypothetical protein [Austropuccinia psidii MF-1]
MLDINSLPPTPIELKSVNPYLQRAKEMDKVDPVIAYWCAFHAAQTSLSIRPVDNQSREFIMRLLDLLEHAKIKLSDHDAITNNLAASAYVENFALRIFDSADDENRSGLSTRSTAQRFLAAACFLEVLSALNNQPESEILQKIKYAKWKATSISKALRGDKEQFPNGELSALSPSADIAVPSSRPVPLNQNEKFEITKPLSIDIVERDTPTPSGWPTSLLAHPISSLPSPAPLHTNLGSAISQTTTFPSTVFPPSQQLNSVVPSAPQPVDSPIPTHSMPSTQPTLINLQRPDESTLKLSSVAHLQGSTSSSTGIDPIKISEIQKHAKWAISALNFEDISTAKKELQIALDALNSIG